MEFKVKYSECDSYQLVHNSNYIAWLEDSLYSEIYNNESLNNEIVISKLRCRYLHAVKYNSVLFIKNKISKITDDKFFFTQEIIDKATKCIMVRSSGEYIIKESYESISS